MKPYGLPTPYDLIRSPELAIMTLLDQALHIAVRALIATYPQLDSDEVPYWCRDSSRAFSLASSIISRAQSLSKKVQQYQTLLPPDPPDAQQITETALAQTTEQERARGHGSRTR